MSTLFPETERAAGMSRFVPQRDDETVGSEPDWLSSPDELKAILVRIWDRERVAPEDRDRVRGFRSRTAVVDWTIVNLTSEKVTTEIFEGHAIAAIEGAIGDIRLSQNNGSWMLLDYEIRTGRPRGSKQDKLGGRLVFVDVTGNEDLKYEGGRLVVSTGATPEAGLQALAPLAQQNAQIAQALALLTQLVAAQQGIANPTVPDMVAAPAAADPTPRTSHHAKHDGPVRTRLPPGPKPGTKPAPKPPTE